MLYSKNKKRNNAIITHQKCLLILISNILTEADIPNSENENILEVQHVAIYKEFTDINNSLQYED